MDRQVRHVIIPISKEGDKYRAILSDDSLDRDKEYMSRSLIEEWAKEDFPLPILSDHDNTMDSFLGGWRNRVLIESNDGHIGLSMEPTFFSEQANPKAQRIKRQIDESLAIGIKPGVSIGFIPLDGMHTSEGYEHLKAEIVEASFVPVQSNRNAYAYIAKRFGIDKFKYHYSVMGAGEKMVDSPNAEKKDQMPEMQALMQTYEEMKKELLSLKDRVTALEGTKSQPEPEASKKLIDLEKKFVDELSTYKKDIETIKGTLNQPRAKMPASMLGIVSKDETPFNATMEVFKKKGLID